MRIKDDLSPAKAFLATFTIITGASFGAIAVAIRYGFLAVSFGYFCQQIFVIKYLLFKILYGPEFY